MFQLDLYVPHLFSIVPSYIMKYCGERKSPKGTTAPSSRIPSANWDESIVHQFYPIVYVSFSIVPSYILKKKR